MTSAINPVALDPTQPAAWCYACYGLRHFAQPTPAVEIHSIPLHVKGKPVGEMLITQRTGACRDCGAEISRVGGGRTGDG